MKIVKNIIFIYLLILTNSLYGQNYFPLEIGNRWDYLVTDQPMTQFPTTHNLTVEVVGNIQMPNGKEYFVTSNFGFLGSKYLRIKDDSLFCFNIEDSTDCLIMVLNKMRNLQYLSCQYDTMNLASIDSRTIFSQPDTQQTQVSKIHISFELSKKFGLIDSDDWRFSTYEEWYYLSGCIISGKEYGSLLSIKDKEERNFSPIELRQNYPNPFNPTTIINYSIPKQSLVIIKVYDVLGIEVASLVNEDKTVGSYSVNFNASKLTSGVYFYRMQAGSFVETKKLILLK